MRYHPSQLNMFWTVLLSILMALSLNACGDANNVTGPPPLSEDAKLASLTITPGTLAPAFSNDVANYSVDVGTAVTSVTMTARAQHAGATVIINGQTTTSRSVSLGGPGSNTPIPIVVTAVNGSQNTYIVTVNRAPPGGNNNLQSLTVSPGALAPVFAASTTRYTVGVGTAVTSVAVTAQAEDAGASVSINGQPGRSQSVQLEAAGTNTLISIVVTAPNGSQKPYLVTVSRAAPGGNNNLQSLTVSPGTLAPPFMPSTTRYTVGVGTAVTSVTVEAVPQDGAGASVSINGQPGRSLLVPLNGAGSNTQISIIVTAPNGSQKPYLVTVNRAALGGNNNLQSLTVSPGALAPAFAVNTPNYTVNVADTVTSVTVEAVPQDSAGASVSINGQPGRSQSVQLEAAGTNTLISIIVTAPNANQKPYSVRVNRAAMVPAPRITTMALPNATLGQDYSVLLGATGGIAPLTWSLVGGSLPDMFNLTPGGQILGSPTPATAGARSDFTVEVKDARDLVDTRPFSITVDGALPPQR